MMLIMLRTIPAQGQFPDNFHRRVGHYTGE
jgi:hypothetical protein